MTERSSVQGGSEVLSPHPHAIDFLAGVYPDTELSLAGSAAKELSEELINFYFEDYTGRTHNNRLTGIANERRAIAAAYVGGRALADIQAETDLPGSLEPHVQAVRHWLHKAAAAGRLSVAHMLEKYQPDASKNDEYYQAWLSQRAQRRSELFGATEGTEDTLATIARSVDLKGTSFFEKDEQARIGRSVGNALALHDAAANGERAGTTYFTPPKVHENKQYLEKLTTHVVGIWHKAWLRQSEHHGFSPEENPSPFAALPNRLLHTADLNRHDIHLILEAASSVMEVWNMGFITRRADERQVRHQARFIAQYGPEYARSWLRGDIIRAYCEQENQDANDWFEYLSPAVMIRIAITNDNPLQATRALMGRLQGPLSPEGIADAHGIPPDVAAAIFPPSIRVLLATSYAQGYGTHVKTVIHELMTNLTTSRIATTLGWSEERTSSVFSEALRAQTAMYHGNKALARLTTMAGRLEQDIRPPEIATLLGWGIEGVRSVFTPGRLRDIKARNSDPLVEIIRIAKNYEQRLSYSRLEEAFGAALTPTQIRILFKHSTKVRLARAKGDPLENARNYTQRVVDLVAIYELPLPIATKIAQSYGTVQSALEVGRAAAEACDTCPPHVGKNMWMWVVAMAPKASRRHHMQMVSQRQSFFDACRNVSLQSTDRIDRELHTLIKDGSADPAELLLPSDALDQVRKLAEDANIAPDILQDLLEHFASSSITDGQVDDLVERLRAAAE